MAASDLAKVEVRVRFPVRAPKVFVLRSSNGRTTRFERVDAGSIPERRSKRYRC